MSAVAPFAAGRCAILNSAGQESFAAASDLTITKSASDDCAGSCRRAADGPSPLISFDSLEITAAPSERQALGERRELDCLIRSNAGTRATGQLLAHSVTPLHRADAGQPATTPRTGYSLSRESSIVCIQCISAGTDVDNNYRPIA